MVTPTCVWHDVTLWLMSHDKLGGKSSSNGMTSSFVNVANMMWLHYIEVFVPLRKNTFGSGNHKFGIGKCIQLRGTNIAKSQTKCNVLWICRIMYQIYGPLVDVYEQLEILVWLIILYVILMHSTNVFLTINTTWLVLYLDFDSFLWSSSLSDSYDFVYVYKLGRHMQAHVFIDKLSSNYF